MRKIALTLAIAVLGLAMATPVANATRNLEDTDITLSENESMNAKVSIDFAAKWDYLDIHVIICSRDALEDCTYQKRDEALRWVCFSAAQPNPDDCLPNPNGPIEIKLFEFTNWIGKPKLSTGIYEIKVIEHNSNLLTNRYLTVELISDSSFVLKYENVPSLTGTYDIGSTLSLQSQTWSPTPYTVEITWHRCNKTTLPFFIRGNVEVPYQNLGIDCYRINRDGTRYETTNDLNILMTISQSSVSSRLRVTNTQEFTDYVIQPNDVAHSITVIISAYGEFDSRKLGVASTPIIEKKTVPVNQFAPKSSFIKTKKVKKLQVGAQVSVTTGTWKWADLTAYQWFRCTKRQRTTAIINTKQCTTIKRATKANYKTKKVDRGRFLVARVTATNEIGSTIIYATSLGKIK